MGMNSIPHGRHNEPTIITDNAYLLSDPSEINQEDTKECWLTRCGKTKDLKLCVRLLIVSERFGGCDAS